MTLVREYQPTFVLGDGETKEFSYLFEEVSENFIKVIVKHSDDSTYVPVFSVDLDSHKVVFGESETAPLDTDLVCIYRETPDLQDTPFRTLQGYDAKALENILSKIVAMIQELKANGFSTQILQGTPWQLDLLHPADDGASVIVDYNARILKKGLYFQIVSGNLQVSADGNNFIKMPKSADITEFRRLETVLEDLTVIYRLQYKVDGVWYNAESNAEATADEALQVAQDAKDIAQAASDKVDTFDDRLTIAEGDASDAKQDASDAKSMAQTTSGNLTTHTSDTNNPHQVTKAQIGLGNVDNTSDLNKPISTATQTALDSKANVTDIPTVGNGTITITQSGTTKGTFTTNQGGNTTIDLDAGGSGLPDQTGNAGKFLTTDGTDASWGTTLTETLYLTGDNTQNKIVFNDGNNDSQKTTLRATWNSILFEHGNDGTFTQAFSFSWLYKAIYPIGWRSSDVVTLGTSNYKWSNVYTNKLNNGADIEVPNQAGTMVVADPTGATQGDVLTLDANGNAVWQAGGSGGGLPDMTGQSGKYLTNNGTTASWSNNTITFTWNSYSYGIVFSTASSGLGIASSVGNPATAIASGAIAIGTGASASGNGYNIAIGYIPTVTGMNSIAIGAMSQVTADNAIQIGGFAKTNADANTVKFGNNNGNFEMMSADGTIPESRLADTTSATQGQVLTLDSNLDAVWADASSGGSGLNVGDTFMTMRTDNELNGAVECDGATYNTTDFTGTESIGELLEAGKLDYVSLSAYSTAISTKGWCDKIGWNGTGNTQFRVPTLNAHIVQTNNIPVVGNGMTLGLTDGTDNAGINSYANSTGLDPWTGLYGTSVGTASSGSRVTANKSMGITTDSTKSGIIADTSDTAQLRVMIQLATGATDTALETCTSVLADVATLKGYDYVVESQLPTAQNNYTWYRKYKSGWVEQGGLNHTISLNSNGYNNMIDLPITMADTQYAATAILSGAYGNRTIGHNPNNSTTTQVCIGGYASQAGTSAVNWQVSGMSAS